MPAISATCIFESITKYRKGCVAEKTTGFRLLVYPENEINILITQFETINYTYVTDGSFLFGVIDSYM